MTVAERMPSWRELAERLGARMESHAFCVDHDETDPQSDCPYCQDRAAFRLYERKAGKRPDPLAGARTVSVDELMSRTRTA